MRYFARVTLRLVFLAQISAHGAPQPPANNEGTTCIRGQVVFKPSQRPLKDVEVRLKLVDYSPLTMFRTGGQGTAELLTVSKTDSKGLFTLCTTRKGRFEIVCFRPGVHAGSGALDVDPNKFVLIQYPVDPKPFRLRPGEKPPPPSG